MNLARTQFISLTTKAITTLLGVVQSIIVVRILSPAEFGLVGLVMSIGGVIGVSQHLGIVDGAIREIAVLKKKREMGKVFWVSHLVRQVVTLPLSVALLLGAGFIASSIYQRPEITLYLQIFAAALVLQGLQDVLGASLTGMKRFVPLYIIQIVTAVINVAAFGWLTLTYGITGFFWAVIVTTAIMVVLLFIEAWRVLGGAIALPSREDVKFYARRVMRVGAYMYLARIFFVVWQRLPILILGGVLAAEELGYLNVSLTFGSRLTIIAMALSEVNLSWMSSLYASQRAEFARVVTRNMQRVLVLMVGMTLVLLFFTPEILQYIIGAEYLPAQPLIYVMTVAFFLYALTDIGTSSVFVSADNPRLRAGVYGSMTTISAVLLAWMFFTNPNALMAAGAVLVGGLTSYVAMVWFAHRKFHIQLLTSQLAVFLIGLGLSTAWLFTEPELHYRIILFVLLSVYIWWEARRSKLLPPVGRALQQFGLNTAGEAATKIICFAGAKYDLPYWTNRQHIMSRVSKEHPVLYVEPRIWIVRAIMKEWRNPRKLFQFFWRLIVWEHASDSLVVISQWNLIPGSRESRVISLINHYLNSWWVLLRARLLGFAPSKSIMWVYDTEAAEYLRSFKRSKVVYDCVDDHAAQAGVDRNPARVEDEEKRILARADLVTVTSRRLFELKRDKAKRIELVLNAGDVKLFQLGQHVCLDHHDPLVDIERPIVGSVGALDDYKIDSELIIEVAQAHPDWQFVFLGERVVDSTNEHIDKLQTFSNIHFTGAVNRKTAPCYVKSFDVCMIPYKESRYNEASFPLKFWEFMATGKPVVVSGLPELSEYRDLIGYASSPSEFASMVEQSLKSPDLHANERIELARKHSWEKRASRLLELLDDIV